MSTILDEIQKRKEIYFGRIKVLEEFIPLMNGDNDIKYVREKSELTIKLQELDDLYLRVQENEKK